MTLKEQQLKALEDQIVGNVPATGKRQMVFPIEAGLGKTTTAIKALLKLYDKDKSVKSLIVTKFKKEANRIETKLNGIGVAIHSDKEAPDRHTIVEAPVLITTQSKYIRLCRSDPYDLWRLYSQGRRNLIIDEDVETLKPICISDSDLFIARECLPMFDFFKLPWFDKLCMQFYEELTRCYNSPNNQDRFINLKQCSQSDIRKVDEIIELIKGAKKLEGNKKIVFYEDMFMESYSVTYSYMISIFRKLKIMLQAEYCVSHMGGFYTDNRGFQYKLLDNNIILDASASITPKYRLSKEFIFVPMKRILDHSNWTINICKLNTSSSWKEKHPEFYDCVYLQAVKILNDKNNRLLIIGKKDEIKKFQNKRMELSIKYKERLSYANFGSMRGKNDWADYNCCLIIHTHYLPSHHYPLELKSYAKTLPLEATDLEMGFVGKSDNRYFGFRNSKVLNRLRQSQLAATVYQACKRIMRNGTAKANVYIITNNMPMIRKVRINLKGATLKEFKLPNQSMIDKNKNRTYNRTEPSIYKTRLHKLFGELASGVHKEYECPHMKGHYTKKWCMMKIKYEGKNFGRFLNEMEEEMLKLGIDKNQHKIIVKKDVQKDYS